MWKATGADIATVCTLTCKWNYLAHEDQFSASLLSTMGLENVPARIPPVILPLGSAAGKLNPQAARAFGLPEGIAIDAGIIDAHAGGLALLAEDPEGSLALIGGTSNCHMIVNREPCQVAGVWRPYWKRCCRNGGWTKAAKAPPARWWNGLLLGIRGLAVIRTGGQTARREPLATIE